MKKSVQNNVSNANYTSSEGTNSNAYKKRLLIKIRLPC